MTIDGTTRHLSVLVAASALLLAGRPAVAALTEAPSPDPFAGLAPVAHSELGQLRGGMMVGGLPVDFAVTVTTMVQGADQAQMGLQTTLTFNGNGGVAGATTTSLGLPQTLTSNSGLTLALGNNATTITQQITHDQVQSLISNAANNLSVAHSTDLNVTLPGFTAANQAFVSHVLAARSVLDSALSGLGR